MKIPPVPINNDVAGFLKGSDGWLGEAGTMVSSTVLIQYAPTKRLAIRGAEEGGLVRLCRPTASAAPGFSSNEAMINVKGHTFRFLIGFLDSVVLRRVE